MKRFLEKIQEMRFLPVFVVLSMVIGIAIGKWYGISNFELTPPIDAIKSIFHGTYQFSLANSLALGVVIGLFLMIYPAMTNVKVEDMGKAARSPRQLLIVLFFNYLVAPFFMLLLAKVFLAGDHDLYVGLVLYGLAPCIAMVIVFTFLALGNNALAIILVAINSVCQMLLIPVYAKLLLGEVTFDVLVVGESVLLYLGLPLVAGFLTRRIAVSRMGEEGFKEFKTYLDSLSIIGLLFTLIVMFALKGDLILERPMIILQMAVPMTIFFWVMYAVVYLTSWKLGLNYKDSVAVAFNATGRDFEIAIAIAITAFSPAVALATVVGPLIEVPIMLALVWASRKSEAALFREIPAVVPVVERVPVFGKILFPTDFSPHAQQDHGSDPGAETGGPAGSRIPARHQPHEGDPMDRGRRKIHRANEGRGLQEAQGGLRQHCLRSRHHRKMPGAARCDAPGDCPRCRRRKGIAHHHGLSWARLREGSPAREQHPERHAAGKGAPPDRTVPACRKPGEGNTRFCFRLAIRQGPLPDGLFAEFATGHAGD